MWWWWSNRYCEPLVVKNAARRQRYRLSGVKADLVAYVSYLNATSTYNGSIHTLVGNGDVVHPAIAMCWYCGYTYCSIGMAVYRHQFH